MGEREWIPSVDQVSDVCDSLLRGDCQKSSVSDYVSHQLEMEETLDI